MVKAAKVLILLVMALAVASFAAACGSDDEGGGEAAAGSKDSDGGGEKAKVAIVLPCPTSDPWCGQGAAGAKALEEQGLATVETTTGAPQETAGVARVLAQHAEQGSNLVIAHSTWQDAALQAAKQYPDANFATVGSETADNVALYEEPIYEGAYLAGMIAGGITKSNTIGGTAGQDVPLCHSYLEAFELGAKRTNDKIKMIDTYIGDWNDIAKGKQAAEAQAEQGVDVFISCGGAPANGMTQLVKERKLSGFGYVGDMSAQAPENMVGSIIYSLEPYFTAMLKDIENDKFRPGKSYKFGMADGGVELKLNDQYSAQEIPDEVMSEVEKVEEQIKSGEFEVPNVTGAE